MKTGRSIQAVSNDIKMLNDMELIIKKRNEDGNIIRSGNLVIYEKSAIIRHVYKKYFKKIADTRKLRKEKLTKKAKGTEPLTIHVPSEDDILDICNYGESQIYEFKAPGIKIPKITKEIAAFLHTKKGGIIFYGIEDDGTILGSDIDRQDFDQRIYNSIRNTISSSPNIKVEGTNVMGSMIIMVLIPPWNRKTLYQYTKNERLYIRKGTNIFVLKPDEIKKLSRGEYIV